MDSSYKVVVAEANYLRILANPKRLQIIHLLQRGQFTVSDMMHMTGIKQANLSQHLMILRHARVVTSVHKGKKVYYHLTRPQPRHIPADLFVTRVVSNTVRTKT